MEVIQRIVPSSQKLEIFEEFLARIYLWYYESRGYGLSEISSFPKNDLSKLKVIKLHFFATTTSPEAISIFNSFYALPYGHVETDIYSKLDELENFEVTNSELILKNPEYLRRIQSIGQSLANRMVEGLKMANPQIIKYSAFDLVKLSHRWFSWRHNYSQAREHFSKAKKISSETIRLENKYYKLGY